MRITPLLVLVTASSFLLASKILAQYESEPSAIRTFEDSKRMLSPSADTLDTDGEYTRFKRWEYRIVPRLLKGGLLPKPDILLDELERYTATHSFFNTPQNFSGGKWAPLGPFAFDSPYANNGGTGRVNVIRFLPGDTSTIFVGTPDGGAWKSTNGGNSWIPLTDHIPSLGVSDIAIDPNNPNIIYLATGDAKDAGMYGNPYSYGILKTTNGGVTWSKTGLSLDITQGVTIPRIVISPVNSSVLLAGVFGGNNRGIQKSTDGGVTWKQKDGGSIYDIVYNPADPTLIYASGYGNFRRSTNGGETWTAVTSTLPAYPGKNVSRTAIGVTPADPNIVYVLYINHTINQIYGLYRSTDKGLNFQEVLDTSQALPFGMYGEYNLILAVSPTDANTVFIGEQILGKSTDGGKHFEDAGADIHYDNHAFVFPTKNSSRYYCGNDGGIFRTTDDGGTWDDLSGGLQISQLYRIGSAFERPDLLYTGAQDNGIMFMDRNIWDHFASGADGGECLVDYSNENIVYWEWQTGYLYRSTDAGQTYKGIAPSSNGHWITPYIIHPKKPQTIYAAYRNVYRTDDRGDHWKTISPALAGNDNLKSLAIAPSNDSVIYAGTYIKLFRTTDAGSTWVDITAGSPTGDTAALTYIAVSPSNPKKVWLTFTGFTDHQHVYVSSDAGATWVNITGSLPNVPVNTIAYERGSADGVYIGTDIGIFYRDNTMTDWQPLMTGLPNVSVTELEIENQFGTIRAATFGRGMWESPLRSLAPPTSPSLRLPLNAAISVAVKPLFSWNRVLLTTGYAIEVAGDSNFTKIVWSRDSLSDTSITSIVSLETGTKYFWHIKASNAAGESPWSAVWSFTTSGINTVGERNEFGEVVNYPNPFAEKTTFEFTLQHSSDVSLLVFDLLGRTYFENNYGALSPGEHRIIYDAARLLPGSYLYTLSIAGKKTNGLLKVMK